jgi:large subunit ribosomal protein L1
LLKKEQIIASLQEMRDISKSRKFQQSVDFTVNFKGIDFKKADNRIDVDVTLPHSTGKQASAKVLVFVKDKTFASELKQKGIAMLLDEEIAALKKKDVENLIAEYDAFFAEGPAMITVGKYLGQILAPKERMPKPVPANITAFENLAKKASSSIKITNKKGKFMPLVHVSIGNEGMSDEELAENALTSYKSLVSKVGDENQNIKSVFVKLTMGPPVRVDKQNQKQKTKAGEKPVILEEAEEKKDNDSGKENDGSEQQ